MATYRPTETGLLDPGADDDEKRRRRVRELIDDPQVPSAPVSDDGQPRDTDRLSPPGPTDRTPYVPPPGTLDPASPDPATPTAFTPTDFTTTAAQDIANRPLPPLPQFDPNAARSVTADLSPVPFSTVGGREGAQQVTQGDIRTDVPMVGGLTGAQDITEGGTAVAPTSVADPRAGQEAASGTTVRDPAGQAYANFQQFASGVLEAPSRFDTALVQQSMDLMNQQLARQREEELRRLDEYHAARGTFGGTPEVYDPNAGRLELGERLDATRAQRLNEILFEQARTLAQDRATAAGIGQAATGLEFERTGMLSDQEFRNRQLELQGLGMDRDEAFRQAALESDQLFRDRMADLEALGMDRQSAFQRAQLESNEAFQNRQQDLMALGMDRESAYRQAAFQWDQEVQSTAMELQATGMDRDEAYRYANLAQDRDFRQRAQELQALGMDRAEAFRQAEAERNQFNVGQDQQFRQDQARRQQIATYIDMLLRSGGIDDQTAALLKEELAGDAF